MREKLKNMSDLKLAFIFGLLMYVSANIGKSPSQDVAFYIWVTAQAMAGAVSILLTFLFIKLVSIVKKIVK